MVNRTQGQSAGLTRERIGRAAVELVDRDGLERFGVRRLAAELGVDPMSIYNHIKGKAALLDTVSATVLAEVGAELGSAPPGGDWIDVARGMAHAYRELAHRHPRVFPLLTTRAQTSPVALAALEQLAAAMRREGVPDRVVADAPLILFGFLNGYLLATLSAASEAASPDLLLAEYPAMAALAPLQAGFGSREEFDRMLETVLGGIRAAAGER
ncbi:TetR/AcrR family transcriptional regulator C-terminal domain-containing protein [Amycolatopsis cynarae]|uniref:TetR/AcrR family transcriptional regulator C-terminal domain-containing protein n=1 Tax=Amycolatopsis cynarae TaxID=2995223 RepID=A0ABY7B1T1_9PSEU|nr:TetR/AcrR family transcriptional regulator [Amycolatopsis sp. HUAS 11-8]WAL65924.1 TetR/AcrR family transcriptional regulator C-terminal domain-containing protein [Amycolatopsis sp. HUAS 11-8]